MNDAAFLEVADGIGARLCRDALWAGDRCTWIGPAMIRDRGRSPVVERTCGPELYAGCAGIGLLLARLAGLTGEALYGRTARAAFRQALARTNSVPPAHRGGVHSGWAGISIAVRMAGSARELCDEQELLDGIEVAGGHDLTAGSAGAILALLRDRPARAVEHGRRLLEHAVELDHGVAWRTGASAAIELTGMAHGASGIAWPLLELWRATGIREFRDVARAALDFERAHFDPEQGNWRDRRAPGGSCMTAWCHGAPGIGLARLRIAELDPDPRVEQELAIAERTVARTLGRLDNFSLCHGVAGNAELWIEGAVRRGEASWLERAREVGLRGIELYEQAGRPWPCGIRGAGETPGLMLGLAGIAWFYLRLHDPVAHPSLLLPVPPEPGAC